MDVFDYRASRTVNTDGVFVVTSNNTEIGGLFMRLKNIMTSELHLQWDMVFLEQYVSEHMVPRSLRWDVHPPQGEPDVESWYKYFNEAGINLLGVLISKKRHKLTLLDGEIKEIKDKLLTHKNSSEYSVLSSNLQKHLEKEDKEQRNKKQKKYSRDVGDYRTGNVFGWQKLYSVNPNDASSAPPVPCPPDTSTARTADIGAQPLGTPTHTVRNGNLRYESPSRTNRYSHDPHTPYNNQRGRGQSRGKQSGRGQQGQGRYPPESYLGPREASQTRQGSHTDTYHQNPYYYDQPPLTTQNRFLPLRNTWDDDFRDEYGYNPGSRHEQSFQDYPPSNTNSRHAQVFHEVQRPRKRGPDPREVQGEVGEPKG